MFDRHIIRKGSTSHTTEVFLKLCCFKIYITSKDYSWQCNSIMFTIPVIILSAIGISIFLANDYLASRVDESIQVNNIILHL